MEHSEKETKKTDYKAVIILAVLALIFVICAVMLIRILLEYKEGEDTYKEIANKVLQPVQPQEQTTPDGIGPTQANEPFVYNHEALLEINPQGVGYLVIPSIDVQLPIVRGSDNEYYLNHTFDRKNNSSGTLFVDSRITGGIEASHVIIYGHNMRNGSMFAGLLKYMQSGFYTSGENQYVYVYKGEDILRYTIFSVYESEAQSDTYTYNFSTVDAMRFYAEQMKEKSLYDTGVDISETTQVLTLSTCTADGERRIVVQAKLDTSP